MSIYINNKEASRIVIPPKMDRLGHVREEAAPPTVEQMGLYAQELPLAPIPENRRPVNWQNEGPADQCTSTDVAADPNKEPERLRRIWKAGQKEQSKGKVNPKDGRASRKRPSFRRRAGKRSTSTSAQQITLGGTWRSDSCFRRRRTGKTRQDGDWRTCWEKPQCARTRTGPWTGGIVTRIAAAR